MKKIEIFKIILIVLGSLGLAVMEWGNVTNLWFLMTLLIIAGLLLILSFASILSSIINSNLKIRGLIGLICVIYSGYIINVTINAKDQLNAYYIIGLIFLLLALVCLYLIENQLNEIHLKDFFANDNEETKYLKNLSLFTLILFFVLIGSILTLSPLINGYIQSLDNTSNNGELVSNSATAVIISTTLGLAVFTPMFSHVLSTMKKHKKTSEKKLKKAETKNKIEKTE